MSLIRTNAGERIGQVNYEPNIGEKIPKRLHLVWIAHHKHSWNSGSKKRPDPLTQPYNAARNKYQGLSSIFLN